MALRFTCFLLGLFLAFPGIGIQAQESLRELRVAAIPDENPQELLRIYKPFEEYLSRELGMPVRFTPVVDYAATVEGLAARKLDLVWYGALTSVQATRRAKGATRIAMRKEDIEFVSYFITRRDSGIGRLEDLKGKTFAFGSVSSTSGHLMPRYHLLQNGIVPEKDFARFSYTGAHDALAAWVQAGRVDAGALNYLVWEKLVEEKKVDPEQVIIFWKTPPFMNYVWVVRGGLDPDLVEKIRRAFLQLDYQNPEHRKLLHLHRATKYLPARDEDWKEIEEAAIAAGLSK